MTSAARRALPALSILLAALSGCGVETAGTAAVSAKAAQEEVRQGQQLEQALTDKINAATLQERQRMDDAAAKADQ